MSSALAADLREGGEWSFRQRWKNALIRRAVTLALLIADRVPARLLLSGGRFAGRLLHTLLGSARRHALDVAGRAFEPARAREVVSASFRRAGENLALSLLLRRAETRPSDWVLVEDETRDTLVRASEGGAIAVSAHLGAFELIPAIVSELGLPASIVVRESYDPALDRLVDAHRLERGIEVIHRGRPGAGTRAVRALRNGRLLGILPDIGGRVPSLDVQFLGARRSLPSGPARLARRAQVPLILVVLERLAGARAFRLRAEILPFHENDSDMTQCVAGHLEAAILTSAEDWLWMAAPTEIADSSAR